MPTRFGCVMTPIYAEPRIAEARNVDLPKHIGTGVLLASKQKHFVVTAAHVLANRLQNRLYLPGSRFIEIKHDVIASCSLAPEIAAKDNVDLCYFTLEKSEAVSLQLSGHSFLPMNPEAVYGGEDDLSSAVFAVGGFPAFSVEVDHEKETSTVEPQYIQDVRLVGHNRITKLQSKGIGIHDRATLVLDLPAKIKINGKVTKRHVVNHLRGISGGGIWMQVNNQPAKLAGIVTEFHHAHSIMLGSRLRPLINVLSNRHPSD